VLLLALTGASIAAVQVRDRRVEMHATATAGAQATAATQATATTTSQQMHAAMLLPQRGMLASLDLGTPIAQAGTATAVAATIAAQPTPTPSPTPTPAATVTPAATATPYVSNGPLPKYRLVTYYGHPQNNLLGILGEFSDPNAMIRQLKQQAAAYQAADPSHPVMPTLELIASVASDTPGDDGLYLNRTPLSLIEQYADIAKANGCLVLLDIQMGYETVANEVQRLAPLLKRPEVHLAIDPEFHVKRGEVPGETFGSVTASDITDAQKLLADIVVQNKLTDKVLVIHQFRDDMLPDKGKIQPVPHVQIAIVMDGFGAPGAKTGNYRTFVHDQPIEYGGIKLFYKQDKPLLKPAEVVALDPPPLVVIYQ
jgi:hypothetical protein